MKIAIFENDYYESIKYVFDMVNDYYYNSQIIIKVYSLTQEFNFNNLNQYDLFFIDLSLGNNSELDGYALIKQICEIDIELIDKVIIITGNNTAKARLVENGINLDENFVIIKPFDFIEINNAIQKRINK